MARFKMLRNVRQAWAYGSTKVAMELDRRADPLVQIQQALEQAHDRHRKMVAHAASLIAAKSVTEQRLNRAAADVDRAEHRVAAALVAANDADDDVTRDRYMGTARSLAADLARATENKARLIEQHAIDSKTAEMARADAAAADAAIREAEQEAQRLRQAARHAAMREHANEAAASLNGSYALDSIIPTLAEIGERVESRFAEANAMAELSGASTQRQIMEIDLQARAAEADRNLAEIATRLGIELPAPAPAPELTEPRVASADIPQETTTATAE